MRAAISWINDMLDPKGRPDSYDGAEHPVLALNLASNIHLMVSDAEVAHDMLNAKNQLLDKSGITMACFSKLMGSSFLFSPTDEDWKIKRKACAHAFYKERLVMMLEVFKEKMADDCEAWSAKIAASYYKKTVINIASVFSKLFARNIIHIAFGEDISNEKLTLFQKTDR